MMHPQMIMLALLLPVSGTLLAAPDMTLNNAQTCQVTGSQSELNFGMLNKAPLQARKISMTVGCRYPQQMVLRIDGGPVGQNFRWGEHGSLRVSFSNARLDNRSVALRNATVTDGQQQSTLLATPGMRITSDGNQMGKTLSFDLTILPDSRLTQFSPKERQQLNTDLKISLE